MADRTDNKGISTQSRKALARQSRNQKNFTEANEGNEEQEKLCQKCAILGNSTAKTPRRKKLFAPLHLCVFALRIRTIRGKNLRETEKAIVLARGSQK
jgi:hypothetical protein